MDKESEEYDNWNGLKKKIQLENNPMDYFPQESEVWMCILGKNIGREQNGGGKNFSRPALVIKKFNNEIFWILPLSRKQKEIDFYYNFTDVNNEKVSVVLSQIKLIHIKRFKRKIYEMGLDDMGEIKKILRGYIT